MRRMNSIKTVVVLALSFTFMVSACTNQAEPTKEKEQEQSSESTQYQSILLNLGGQEAQYTPADDTEARAVAFEVGAAGPKLKMTEEKIGSVAVIANQDKSRVYYIEILWSKESGKNRLFVKDYEVKQDLDGKTLSLDANQTWYIMGYVGGTYDKTTKRVKYNPNGLTLQAGANGEVIKKAVPVYFPWTKLEVKHYGSYQLALSGLDKINFKTLGTIMRVTLKNSFGENVRLKSLRFLSNSLRTTAGYYKLDGANLPAIGATTLPQFSFETAATAESDNYYRSLDETSYTLQTNAGTATNVDLANGTTSSSFLIWAMPDATKPTKPVTHLLANVARLKNGVEQNDPKMETLYVWGTNRVFAERSRQHLAGNIVRAKMALEYFAPDYVGYGEMVNTIAYGLEPFSSTDKGIPLFSHDQIQYPNLLTNGWRVPKYKDLRGLFMVDLSDVNGGSYRALAFIGSTALRTVTQDVRVDGQLATYTDVYKMGASIYALRFANQANGQKLYSAWRYSYNSSTIQGALVEAVYLGPSFKGTIDDILHRRFWEIHEQDKISRFYTASEYMYYNNLSNDWTAVDLVNTWAIHEPIPKLSSGQRVWGFGHENTWYMGHRQHYYGNTNLEHIAHIIPLQTVGTSWKNN